MTGMHFERMAAEYATARPPYPSGLYDTLATDGVIGPGTRVLEIGAGSGLATGELVRAGSEVVAIEPGPELASLLRRDIPGVSVLLTRLEDAELPAGSFDSVVAATSMHWVDLSIGLPKLHAALRPGGSLAVWHHQFGDDSIDTEFRRRVGQIVAERRRRDEVEGHRHPPTMDDLEIGAWFEPVRTERWRWSIDLDTNQLRSLFRTFSDWDTSEVEAVARAADELGGGRHRALPIRPAPAEACDQSAVVGTGLGLKAAAPSPLLRKCLQVRRHDAHQLLVSRAVGSDDKAAAGLQLGASEVGHDAARRAAELDSGGEVHVVDETAVADVARTPSGRHPRNGERGRGDPRTERRAEGSVDHLRPEERSIEGSVAVDVDEPRSRRWGHREVGSAGGPDHGVRAVGPEHLPGDRVGGGRGNGPWAVEESHVDRHQRCLRREVESPAQWVDEPPTCGCRATATTCLLALDGIARASGGDHVEDRALRLDVRVRREVDSGLRMDVQRSPVRSSHDRRASLSRRQGDLDIARQRSHDTSPSASRSAPNTRAGPP
jgi:SAM-dependent methyltransferase